LSESGLIIIFPTAISDQMPESVLKPELLKISTLPTATILEPEAGWSKSI
jgi:hypothetical protein